MVLLAISVLVLLGIANYWLEPRGIYPPVVFCAIWAFDLALIWLSGDLFLPISEKTILIFCFGALVFSLGSCCALVLPQRCKEREVPFKASNHILNMLVALVVCSAPFVFLWIKDLTSQFPSAPVLMAARMAMLDLYSTQSHDLWMPFFIVLSVIAAMMAYAEKGNKRAWIAISTALVLTLLTGGRSASIALILSLICIDYAKNKRIRWQILIATAASITIIFAGMAILVQNGQARTDAPFSENVRPVLDALALYTGGGPVAFDQIVRSPNIIAHEWQVTTFFAETANKLGASIHVPTRRADFVIIGPHFQGNVYSMYFAYWDLGYLGMMGLTFCLGFGTSLFYKAAIAGERLALIMYSYLFAAIILSPFADEVFMELNFILKLFFITWFVYKLPGVAERFCQSLESTSSRFPGQINSR